MPRHGRDEDEVADIGWQYGRPDGGSTQKVICNFCGKKIGGGGITRLKHHLIGKGGDVTACLSCPREAKEIISKSVQESKMDKQNREKRRAEFIDAVAGDYGGNDNDDDDIAYPSDIETYIQKMQYKRALRESRNDEDERRQMSHLASTRPKFGPSIHEGGGGSSKGERPKQTTLTRGVSLRDPASMDPALYRKGKQRSIKNMWGNAKEVVERAYVKFAFHNAIPANSANSPYLQHFVDVAGQYGTGVKAPTSYEIMNKYLPMEVKELKEYINGLKNKWPEYGVTIMSDGWTGPMRQSIINFMVYCDGKTVFLKSIEASDVVKDYKFIYKHMADVIKVVGRENVVQIVTDNGSNYKKAGQKIMSKYQISWTPCAAHCIDLMLKDIGKKKTVKKVVDEARSVTNFLYNHGYILSIMRNMCGGDLVRPGLTRFATNYIALQSMLDKKVGLKQLFSSNEWNEYKESRSVAGKRAEEIVGKPSFWDQCRTVVGILEPIVKVLRMLDGDKKPTMGSLYHAIRLMKEAIKAVAPRSYQGYHTIIDNRWTNMLLHPLHSAAYYLNPKYQYTQQLATRADLIEDLQIVVAKLEPDASAEATALGEIKMFRDALGSFGRPAGIAGRHKTLPAEWWVLYGGNAPNLRKIAIKVLSQTASSSGCERNWSTFNLIHSKRRNRLGHENLQKLVYVHYNTRLRMKHTSIEENLEDYTDPIDLTDIFCENDEDDPLYEWVKEVGEPVLDAPGGRPNPIIAEQMQDDDDTLPPDTEGLAQPIGVPIQGTSDDDLSIDSPSDDDTGGNAAGGGGSVGGARTSGGGGSVGGDEPYRPLSPFTAELRFDHVTQDEDHGARSQPRQRQVFQRRWKYHPTDEEDDSLHAHSRYGVDSLTDTFESLSVEGGIPQSYGYGPIDASFESGWGSTASYGYGYGHEYGYGMSYDSHAHGEASSSFEAAPIALVPTMAYPRVGLLMQVEPYVYQYYVQQYQQSYVLHMSWQEYYLFIENQIRQQMHRAHHDQV
ncbi:uncharacterized protein LOC143888647 [Tasmannia lanceolata]|uniref:uncharacterized protein LOC143888647 n=1 Tax=Tasmannia lanceolata TaxID=3420 RepID=UPI004062C8BB